MEEKKTTSDEETHRVWILEDDPDVQFVYLEMFHDTPYDIEFYGQIKEFADAIERWHSIPQLIIADVKLPDGLFTDYLSTADMRRLVHIPLLVVSSVDDAETYRSCFNSGATDYITKPFNRNEILYKVEHHVKVKRQSEDKIGKSFTIDEEAMEIRNENGHIIRLTPKEYKIFMAIRRGGSEPVKRERIIERVWGPFVVGSKTLDVHLFNLRRKTAEIGLFIDFVHPEGFILSKRVK